MISTKGRYGLRVMIDLAQHGGAGYVPLVSGVSGRSGGYRLCGDPAEITVAQILETLEGTLSTVACLECGAPPCPRASFCRTLPLWAGYDRLTRDYFGGIHLSDLLEEGRVF